jgi:uncharacterized membrane protein YdbT with pleckstrin-like domain
MIAAAVGASQGQVALTFAALIAAFAVILLAIVRYMRWTSRVWVLTDRRVIARAGILNRTHAAVLLERVTEGLHEIAIIGPCRFCAQLTDALTPAR